MNHNLGKQSINKKLLIHSVKFHKDFFKSIYHSYGLWVIRKDETQGIKELLENTWLKSNRNKRGIGSLVKTAAEIESDLITNHKNKLKIDDFPLPGPFKVTHGWMEEDEGIAFRLMLSYPDIFILLIFHLSKSGRKDLSDLTVSSEENVENFSQ